MKSVQKNFRRHLDSLAEVFDLIDRFSVAQKVDADSKHALSVAIDELFTNMVNYNPQNTNEILIELRADSGLMTVNMVDRDVEKFDITKRADPYLGDALDKRNPGGLGIYLTKKLVDDVQYQYGDRTSIISLKKKFRRKNV